MKKIALFVIVLFVIVIATVIFLGLQNEIGEVHFSEQKNKICSDIEFVKYKFPNIKEIKSVSYIYKKESGDREVGLEKIYFEGIINVGNSFSKEIEKECDWEKCDKPLDLLIETNLVSSKSEARRLIEQNGISLNQEKVKSTEQLVTANDLNDNSLVLQKGKKVFLKVIFE